MSSNEASGSDQLSGTQEKDSSQMGEISENGDKSNPFDEQRCDDEPGDGGDEDAEDGSDNSEEEDDDDGTEEEDGSEESEDETVPSELVNGDTIKPPMSPNSVPTCYICLNEFEGQDVGSPDSCENIHHFCLECIEEWSKQINTCPVDRKSFSFIIVKRDINGEVIMKVPVSKTSVVEIEAMDDDVTYCEICGRCDREDRLLLCDGCDFGYHCECLTPPIDEIPVDEWFCPECFERLFGDEMRQETYRRQSSSRRAIARTGAFEIVRNRILARRTTQPTVRSQNASTSSSNSTTNRRTTRKTTRRKTTKRRKTRKTTKKATKGKKTKRRRKGKKRTRKSKFSNQRLPASAAIRSRIASKLGISCKPKSPFGLPSMKSKSISVAEIRASAGIASLSMFGYELELNNPRSYGEEFEFESSFGGVGLIARARSHISLPISRKSIKSPEPIAHMSSSDLLGEIMSSQEILHATSCDLTIARNGRIYLKPDAKNIQKCPDSNSHSSSSSSSPSSSNSSNGGSTATNGGNNNGYLKQASYSEPSSNSNPVPDSDISLVKPSPVVALLDEKPDFELYSDIESVGDNKEEAEEAVDKNSSTTPSSNNTANCDKKEQKTDNDFSGAILPVDSLGKDDQHKSDNLESPSKDKSSDANSKAKRRPSIKDLFGGDSEEEDDDELKQLVAQQGSINVHYPIKMPIVLKTSFFNENKNHAGDDVPISKKWIPIYPEVEKNKNTGPKWKAIGPTNVEKSDWKASNRNAGNLNDKPKISSGTASASTKMNDATKIVKKDIKGVIIERRIGLSRTVEMAAASKANELKPASSVAQTAAAAAAPSAELSDKSKSGSETAAEKKVRVCKHGRVIKKEKAKDAPAETTTTRTRSLSVELVDKKSKAHSSDLHEDKGGSDSRHSKKRRHSDEPEDDLDVNWKKLSSSSKMRNYRDGKFRDSELLYKERPPRSEPYSTRADKTSKSSHRDAPGKDTKRDYKSDRDGHRKNESEHRQKDRSSPSNHRSSRRRTSSKTESDLKNKDGHRSSSRRLSPELESKDSKGSKSHKHHNHHHHHHKRKHDEDERGGGGGDEEKEKDLHSRRHHHRHHHPSKSSLEKPSQKVASGNAVATTTTSKPIESNPAKPSASSYQTYPVIKSFDSKEIYSEGDKIIINVSFKREEPCTAEDSRGTSKKDLEAGKQDAANRKDSAACNSNKDNVDILSPQSTDDYSSGHLQSDNSITSPPSGDDSGRSNLNSKMPTSENMKKVLSEEFNFLPRILQMKDTNNSSDLRLRSPEHYLDDSFLPTPTQDESHSPITNVTSGAANTRHGKSSNSILSTSPAEAKDDFYDPEVPLQSPDRDSEIKSPSKDKSGFDSGTSPKDSSNAKRDNLSLSQAIPSTSSLSSTVAAATATLASLNSINLAQLLQIAQSFKSQTKQNNGSSNSKMNSQKSQSGNQSKPGEVNNDITDIVDMEVDSPSPFSSPFNSRPSNNHSSASLSNVKDIWDQIVKSASERRLTTAGGKNSNTTDAPKKHSVKFDLDEQPTSAVEMVIKDKYIKKLNRQERVVEEVKISLKPHYQKKKITKDEYKEILRKAVPKICHSKTGEINPLKIQKMVEQYIKRYRYLRKKPTN